MPAYEIFLPRVNEEPKVAIAIHVDDLLIAAESLTVLNMIKSGLRQEFKMKDLGKVQ